ncbi:DUF5071 domain-containing protein [Paenibacillus oenotherae]|uniref:DUF5071 domain-containing protein n=1 Tax=Paenibacillus oenotherae TaxID=1435645 RepID=A0ABS7D673_9BACL|nr:DUF5071 domain-containing protein [Paenibacillus oenotherae]MBW7475366.1 DUF5071 domain-containing protein [Paenibacillus oenotherae]
MLIGKWSRRGLGEILFYDNEVIVFLPNGSGWLYVMKKRVSLFETFIWKYNENGSLYIEGKTHEYNEEEIRASRLFFQEIFYEVEVESSGRTITFSAPIGGEHVKFGRDDYEVPDLEGAATEEEKIHERIKLLHWDTPRSIREDAVQQLIPMDNAHLSLLLQPLGKPYWHDAALILCQIEHSRLEPLIPGMIEWMFDLNWPGAAIIAELICRIGEPAIPHLKYYLLEGEDQLISWILSEIVENWPPYYVVQLKDDLVSLTLRTDVYEGIQNKAKMILEKRCRN